MGAFSFAATTAALMVTIAAESSRLSLALSGEQSLSSVFSLSAIAKPFMSFCFFYFSFCRREKER